MNYLRNYHNTMIVIIMRLTSLRGVKSLFANKTFRSVKKRMKEQEVHIIYMKEAMEGNEVRDPRLLHTRDVIKTRWMAWTGWTRRLMILLINSVAPNWNVLNPPRYTSHASLSLPLFWTCEVSDFANCFAIHQSHTHERDIQSTSRGCEIELNSEECSPCLFLSFFALTLL